MRILVWHVHGGWMDSFVRGRHQYLIPATPDRGPWGLGRGGRDWPPSAREIAPALLRDEQVDAVIVQRPEEVDADELLLGRRPGRDVPAVYVEHNTPKRGHVPDSRHPLADQSDIPIVHVTHFNALVWDTGSARTTVVEHGVADPGPLYVGDRPTLGVVINEPLRRGRVTGTDLLARFAAAGPLDAFGMGWRGAHKRLGIRPELLHLHGDVAPRALHERLAHARAYVHPMRWTSLGLSLLEAMHLAMPVIALGTTEAWRAVPPEAGAISTDVGELVAAARRLLRDPPEARRRGRSARAWALEHYGLAQFLERWDTVLHEECDRFAARHRSAPPAADGSAHPRAVFTGRELHP